MVPVSETGERLFGMTAARLIPYRVSQRRAGSGGATVQLIGAVAFAHRGRLGETWPAFLHLGLGVLSGDGRVSRPICAIAEDAHAISFRQTVFVGPDQRCAGLYR